MNNLEMLKELGFTEASSDIEKKLEMKRKMTIAYENYRFVTPEIFNRFNEDLKKRTLKRTGKAGVDMYHNYDRLQFTPVARYKQVPPAEALEAMKVAKDRGCFDSFEVAKIESVQEYKDPIIFGCINGCDDKFYIAQWDNDVKIEQILNEFEG